MPINYDDHGKSQLKVFIKARNKKNPISETCSDDASTNTNHKREDNDDNVDDESDGKVDEWMQLNQKDTLDVLNLSPQDFKKWLKEGRMTLGPNCSAALIKELMVLHRLYLKAKANAGGSGRRKGCYYYEHQIKGNKTALRRKKPAWKLLAYDHKKYLAVEKEYQHKVGCGYMKMKSAFKTAVEDHIKAFEQAGSTPVNMSLFTKYCDLFGLKEDIEYLAKLNRESD
eukprot:937448_1